MIVTHKKGFRCSNLFAPGGKKIWNKPSLEYSVKFLDSCLYPPLPLSPITGLDENASWHKLIYIGAFDPHKKGANFGWRHYNGQLEIAARVYDNDTGDNVDHQILWETVIQPNITYLLRQTNNGDTYEWYFGKTRVATWDEAMPTGWLSAPFFGGGAGLFWQGNVPNQDIQFEIKIL